MVMEQRADFKRAAMKLVGNLRKQLSALEAKLKRAESESEKTTYKINKSKILLSRTKKLIKSRKPMTTSEKLARMGRGRASSRAGEGMAALKNVRKFKAQKAAIERRAGRLAKQIKLVEVKLRRAKAAARKSIR